MGLHSVIRVSKCTARTYSPTKWACKFKSCGQSLLWSFDKEICCFCGPLLLFFGHKRLFRTTAHYAPLQLLSRLPSQPNNDVGVTVGGSETKWPLLGSLATGHNSREAENTTNADRMTQWYDRAQGISRPTAEQNHRQETLRSKLR